MKIPIEFLAISHYSDNAFTDLINEAMKSGFIVIRSGYIGESSTTHWAHLEKYRDNKLEYDMCIACQTDNHCRGKYNNCECYCNTPNVMTEEEISALTPRTSELKNSDFINRN